MSEQPTESADASERAILDALSQIPIGSTLRHEVPIEPTIIVARSDVMWSDIVPAAGTYSCARCRVATVDFPGMCAGCCALQEAEDADAEFAAATSSIPEAFRWATSNAPELRLRCGVTTGNADELSKRIGRIAMRLMTGEVRNVTIRGPADAGKTSLACAVLSTVIEGGRDAWALHRREPTPKGRPVPAEPRLATVARASRFVAANELLIPRSRDSVERSSFDIAKSCAFLVLDDLGQELQARDDAISNSERAQAVKDVIAHRWNKAKPTLITTYMSDEELIAMYAGGTQKRLSWASEVMLINLGGSGGKK